MNKKFNLDFFNCLPPWDPRNHRFALVKFGGGIVQMSGSISGDTFARNRSGNYSRARTTPVNPNTDLQQQVRNAVQFISSRWGDTLTAAQRTAWNLYANSVAMLNKLGETIYLSGYNHYMRSNSIRKRSGFTIVDAGPVIFSIPQGDPVFTCSGSEATQQISVAFDNTMAWANEDDGYMLVFMGSPQNAQRYFFDGPWRIMGAVVGDSVAAPASPQLMSVPFAVTEGQHIWCYARILRADGRLSEPFRHDFFCAA